MYLEPSYLKAVSGSAYLAYPTASVTLNSPEEVISLGADNPVSALGGADIHLATVTLDVISGGVVIITGQITEIFSAANGVQERRSNLIIDAGTGYAHVSAAPSGWKKL